MLEIGEDMMIRDNKSIFKVLYSVRRLFFFNSFSLVIILRISADLIGILYLSFAKFCFILIRRSCYF